MKKVISIIVCVLMVAFSTVPAFAEVKSPGADFKYDVYMIPTEGGTGGWYFTSEINEDGQQGVHIYPIANPGYTFDHWELRGDYKADKQEFPVKDLGTLAKIPVLAKLDANGNDDEAYGAMNLTISSDLYCYPYFVKTGTTEVATATANVDNGSKSPQTGFADTSAVYVVIILSLLFVAAGAVTAFVVAKKR